MGEVMKDVFISDMSTILIVSGVIIMILAIVFKGVQINTGPSLPGRRPPGIKVSTSQAVFFGIILVLVSLWLGGTKKISFSDLLKEKIPLSEVSKAGKCALLGEGGKATSDKSILSEDAIMLSSPPKAESAIPLFPSSTSLIKGEFVETPPYRGNCRQRPPGSVCITYSDGYIWLSMIQYWDGKKGEPIMARK